MFVWKRAPWARFMFEGDGGSAGNPGLPPKSDGEGGGAEAGATKDPGDEIAFTPAQQEHLSKLLGKARQEGRDKALKDLQAKADADAATAEEARLKEQQQWQDLATKYQNERDAAYRERDEAKRSTMMIQVAAKFGLPPEIAERIKGGTQEEMEADAKTLAKFLPKPSGPGVPPSPDGNGQKMTDQERASVAYKVRL